MLMVAVPDGSAGLTWLGPAPAGQRYRPAGVREIL